MRAVTGVVVFMCCLAVGVASQGQRAAQPPPPQNLQVLPKDIPRAQLTQIMQGFRVALGVECTHCHVSQQDRASDEKPQKRTARKMLQMTLAINNEYMKDSGETPPAAAPATGAPPASGAAPAQSEQKVTCYTCHRGVLKPPTAPGTAH